MPQNPVFHLEDKYNGKPTAEKYEQVAKALDKDATCLLVTTLDDICWLLNLRGTDIEYNPVFFSYLIFYPKDLKATLYIEASKVESVKEYLDSIKVSVKPYEQISADLKEMTESDCKIAFDKNKANSSLHKIVVDKKLEVTDVIASCKMVKNATEAQGMRDANIRDCAAIMKYFAFLEEELAKPDHGLDEFKGS